MTYSFHPEARTELNEAIDYYENRHVGLGYDFAIEVHSAIERAVNLPDAWSPVNKDIQRSLVNRFPFGVLYSKLTDEILILAVMHLHREPNYWQNRKPDK